jgi:geranylgeranyl diphosphate synthase type II
MSQIATKDEGAGALHLKAVPAEGEARRRVRAEAVSAAALLDRRRPPRREELEAAARGLAGRLGLGRAYTGFAMVAINNEFWRAQFAAVPPARRLLLLPHCLRHVTDCKGSYDARGLACAGCGACPLGAVKAEAEALGYSVLIAEGTPAVVDTLRRGPCDAILGMACLDSLERAFSRVRELGIPNVAVPLLTNGCSATTAEMDVLHGWLRCADGAGAPRTRSYLPALRQADGLFDAGAAVHHAGGLRGRQRSGLVPPGRAPHCAGH